MKDRDQQAVVLTHGSRISDTRDTEGPIVIASAAEQDVFDKEQGCLVEFIVVRGLTSVVGSLLCEAYDIDHVIWQRNSSSDQAGMRIRPFEDGQRKIARRHLLQPRLSSHECCRAWLPPY
jgi:hypothetical protein